MQNVCFAFPALLTIIFDSGTFTIDPFSLISVINLSESNFDIGISFYSWKFKKVKICNGNLSVSFEITSHR